MTLEEVNHFCFPLSFLSGFLCPNLYSFCFLKYSRKYSQFNSTLKNPSRANLIYYPWCLFLPQKGKKSNHKIAPKYCAFVDLSFLCLHSCDLCSLISSNNFIQNTHHMNLIHEKKCISVVHVDSVKIFWGGGGTVSLWIFMSVTENMAKQLFAKPLNSYQDLNIYVHMYIYMWISN